MCLKPLAICVLVGLFFVLIVTRESASQSAERFKIYNNSTGKYGFIDRFGKIAIECKFFEAENFAEGLRRVKLNGSTTTPKWAFIDAAGKTEISPKDFLPAMRFSEERAVVARESDGLMGCIDVTGKQVVSFQFDYLDDFKHGIALMGSATAWGKTILKSSDKTLLL